MKSVHRLILVVDNVPHAARTIAADKENILRAIRNGYYDLILRRVL